MHSYIYAKNQTNRNMWITLYKYDDFMLNAKHKRDSLRTVVSKQKVS